MSTTPAQRALAASATSLLVSVACVALFLPPMVARTVASIPLTVLVGTALSVAMLLHWVFLGIAARRQDRSALGWVAAAVFLFPVGGLVGLLLMAFYEDERKPEAA